MNCERIQELILTDYLDGVLELKVRKELEGHLVNCPQCREFAAAARKVCVEQFEGIVKAEPPQHVWMRIEDTIQQEHPASNALLLFWRKFLDDFSFVPRPVWALASVLLLFVAAGSFQQLTSSRRVVSDSSVEYMVSLVESSNDISTADSDDFGTNVEQVFL